MVSLMDSAVEQFSVIFLNRYRKVIMNVRCDFTTLLLTAAIFALSCIRAAAQAGFDDDRVMLQGFYWESYRHGDPHHPEFGNKKWYTIVGENAKQIVTRGLI